MILRTARQGGWLWPAVLAVSVVLILVAGKQFVAAPTVAADVPVAAQLEPVTPSATPTASVSHKPKTTWSRRSSAPRKPTTLAPPERLIARTVGLDLHVVPTGVAKNGQMALPEKPSQLGWYEFGAAPGDRKGAVVAAGHVDSDQYGAGPLTRLVGLDRGDLVDLPNADGDTTTYEVVKVQRISKSDFSPADDRSGAAVLRVKTGLAHQRQRPTGVCPRRLAVLRGRQLLAAGTAGRHAGWLPDGRHLARAGGRRRRALSEQSRSRPPPGLIRDKT